MWRGGSAGLGALIGSWFELARRLVVDGLRMAGLPRIPVSPFNFVQEAGEDHKFT